MSQEVPAAGTAPAPPPDDAIAAGGADAERELNSPTARRDFRLLWAGQSVSLLGDQFMLVALPLMAITTVGVSASKAALLPFAFKLPFLVLGLPAGAILDRIRRRPTLISSELIQMLSFLLMGVLAAFGALSFALMVLLVVINGCVTVFFQVAYTSFLPSFLKEPRALQRANARLELSESVSRSVGPAIVGPLIALTGPVGAIFANSGSFFASAATLLGIRNREEPPQAEKRMKGWLRKEISEGLNFVIRHPILEPVLMCGAVYVLFQGMVNTILVLYCSQVLKLGFAEIGLVIGAAALGFPLGNLTSNRVVEKIGPLPAIVLGASVSAAGFVMMPIFGSIGSVAGLVAGSIIHGVGEGTFGPTWLTLRQTITPGPLLGRVNSVERFLLWGVVPLGSLAASILIALIGLPATLWVGALGTVACLPPLLRRGVLAGLRRHADT